jgi:hypothetical protein
MDGKRVNRFALLFFPTRAVATGAIGPRKIGKLVAAIIGRGRERVVTANLAGEVGPSMAHLSWACTCGNGQFAKVRH